MSKTLRIRISQLVVLAGTCVAHGQDSVLLRPEVPARTFNLAASDGAGRTVESRSDQSVDDSQEQTRDIGPGHDLPYQLLDATAPALDSSPASRPALITSNSPTHEGAITRPEAESAAAGRFPAIGGTYSLDEFVHHFAPHEPMYFVGGTKSPNIKFQFSLRYRILNPEGPLATRLDLLKGFNFAYSQTSLWDVSNPDQPFFYDSSYRPELFYYFEKLPFLTVPQDWQAGLQGGVGHESNGQKDPDHRSLNIIYLRPIFTVGSPSNDLFVTIAPKFYYYIAGLSLNRDLPKYRGYCDMRIVMGQRDGLQLATIGRLGSNFDKGSLQFDLTYPLTKLLAGNLDVALNAQYFVGYGDTLLTYNHYSNIFRIGLAIVR